MTQRWRFLKFNDCNIIRGNGSWCDICLHVQLVIDSHMSLYRRRGSITHTHNLSSSQFEISMFQFSQGKYWLFILALPEGETCSLSYSLHSSTLSGVHFNLRSVLWRICMDAHRRGTGYWLSYQKMRMLRLLIFCRCHQFACASAQSIWTCMRKIMCEWVPPKHCTKIDQYL